MTKKAANSRSGARVVPLRKGTTLQMVRLACPDSGQCSLISESFGLPVLDSDGNRSAGGRDDHHRRNRRAAC